MGRAKAIQQAEYPYHVTGRCINREWFNLPMSEVWKIFGDELNETIENKKIVVHSFVLMTNHYHLIVSTPEANISEAMHRFMGRTSRSLNLFGNRINETFAGRHFKSILHHHNHYLNAYKYNYRNPVAAGICKNVEDYPYSTLFDLVNRRKKSINIVEDLYFNSSPLKTLEWLNTKPEEIKLEAVRVGLSRQYFSSGINPRNKRPMLNDGEII